MTLFGKKRDDVIDLTRYKKSIELREEPEVIDLVKNGSKDEAQTSGVNLNFMDNLQDSNLNSAYGGAITDSLREARKAKLKSAFNDMKVKIEDNDYKMNNMIRKMHEMEDRIKELERNRY